MAKYHRKPAPCRCAAYPFPHRKDSKACRELYNSELEAGYDAVPDTLDTLGLRSLFAPVNYTPIRNPL